MAVWKDIMVAATKLAVYAAEHWQPGLMGRFSPCLLANALAIDAGELEGILRKGIKHGGFVIRGKQLGIIESCTEGVLELCVVAAVV